MAELLEEQSKSFFDLQSSRPPGTTVAVLIPVLSRRGQGRESSRRALLVALPRKRTMLRAFLLVAVAFFVGVGASLDPDLGQGRQQQIDCDSPEYQKSSLTLLSSKKFAAMYLRTGHMRQFEASGISIGPTGKGENVFFFFSPGRVRRRKGGKKEEAGRSSSLLAAHPPTHPSPHILQSPSSSTTPTPWARSTRRWPRRESCSESAAARRATGRAWRGATTAAAGRRRCWR